MNEPAHLISRLKTAFETAGSGAPRAFGHPLDMVDGNGERAWDGEPTAGAPPRRPSAYLLVVAVGGFAMTGLALSLDAELAVALLALSLLVMSLALVLSYGLARLRAASDGADRALAEEDRADCEWINREKQGLLAGIHEGLGDIALVRDRQGRIVEANSILRALVAPADVLGRTCADLGFRFEPGAADGRLVARFEGVDEARVFIWGDVVVRDPGTGELVTESVARDISKESRAVYAAEQALRKAEQASAAKSRLLATVAHEIRTPLTGLLGMADLLENSRLAADQRNYVAGLRQSGQVLSHLVEDLLDFATMEAGRFELRPVAESPRRLIEGIVEMLAPRAHFKGLEIASFISPEVPEYLELDPARLRQVLFNLAGNAVKFTQRGGVSVEAAIEDQSLVIRVVDTGPGMSAGEQARIFEEFVQAGTSEAKSGGKGLGLSISARIIEAFGGAITVSSIRGEGSTFTIRIPMIADGRHQVSRHGQMARSTVLLMAPDGPAARSIVRTITALGGHCVRVGSEAEAVTVLAGAGPDGRGWTDVVVDHRLEREFTSEIIRSAERMRLRRIFLVNPEQRQARISGPYDAWLIRPLREQSLIDVLRGRLRGLEKRGATNDNLPAAPMQARAPAPGLARILLGEDDPVNTMLVKATLERAGYAVRHAADFASLLQALEAPGSWHPDLVLTDLNMPGGYGIDMLGVIRARHAVPGGEALPMIVLTGEGGAETRALALRAGAVRVLQKPVSPADLLAEIHATLLDSREALQS